MGIVSGIVVYVIVWWLVFFMVLPWGVRAPEEQEVGHQAGAPQAPRMWLKALITTLVAAVLWVGIDVFIVSDVFSFRQP
ncbi:putative secreted protein [Constrictibacter sp. MBR-5]|uniref:DUF1467 family protein n=1 Tax=Constrictibacter sp. MBR-5 TaxID=3156467 RepID=UPI0033977E3F